jgi:hypothetical protein
MTRRMKTFCCSCFENRFWIRKDLFSWVLNIFSRKFPSLKFVWLLYHFHGDTTVGLSNNLVRQHIPKLERGCQICSSEEGEQGPVVSCGRIRNRGHTQWRVTRLWYSHHPHFHERNKQTGSESLEPGSPIALPHSELWRHALQALWGTESLPSTGMPSPDFFILSRYKVWFSDEAMAKAILEDSF